MIDWIRNMSWEGWSYISACSAIFVIGVTSIYKVGKYTKAQEDDRIEVKKIIDVVYNQLNPLTAEQRLIRQADCDRCIKHIEQIVEIQRKAIIQGMK